jgi:hypothetical protein
MDVHSNKVRSRVRLLLVLAATGALAFAALGTLGALDGGDVGLNTGPRISAGSGSAPANTVYTQPVVGGMNMGATATMKTPNSVPQVTMAVPPVRAR